MMFFMKYFSGSRRTLLMFIFAVPMLVLISQFMTGGRDYLNTNPGMMELKNIEQQDTAKLFASVAPASGGDIDRFRTNIYRLGLDFDETSLPQPSFSSVKNEKGRAAAAILRGLEFFETKRPFKKGNPRITIIIDDMGMGKSTTNMLKLPKGNMTFSYLPYAPNLSEQTKRAAKAGHELMLHMPMQPLDDGVDPGPGVLKTDMNKDEFQSLLNKNLGNFKGYVGINNHMGSKLTQDTKSMKWVMDVLKKRGLLFIDSRTIQTSVGAETAASFLVPYEERDVFLDHSADIDIIRKSLKQLENIALSNGHAIAIGHPRPTTIQALNEWLPTLKKKGITLVKISDVVKKPKPLPALISSQEKITSKIYQ